jgi:hypothetical protein
MRVNTLKRKSADQSSNNTSNETDRDKNFWVNNFKAVQCRSFYEFLMTKQRIFLQHLCEDNTLYLTKLLWSFSFKISIPGKKHFSKHVKIFQKTVEKFMP